MNIFSFFYHSQEPSRIVVEKSIVPTANGHDATTNAATPPSDKGAASGENTPNDQPNNDKPDGSPSSTSTLSPPSPGIMEVGLNGNGTISSPPKHDLSPAAASREINGVNLKPDASSAPSTTNGAENHAEKLPQTNIQEYSAPKLDLNNCQVTQKCAKDTEKPPNSIVATTVSSSTTATTTLLSDLPVNKLTTLKRKNDTVPTSSVPTAATTVVTPASSNGVPEQKKLKKDVMSRFNHPSSGTTTEGFAQPSMMASSSSTATSSNVIVSNVKPLPSLPALNGPNRFSATPSTANGPSTTGGAFPPPLPSLPPHPPLPVSSSSSTVVRASRTDSSALHLPIPEVAKTKNMTFHVPPVSIPNRNESNASTGSVLNAAIENHVTVARSHVLHRVRVTVSSSSSSSSSADTPNDAAWEQFLEKPILLVESSHRVTCVACEDSTLHLFSAATGTRLFPAIVVGSKAFCIKVCKVLDFLRTMRVHDQLSLYDGQTRVNVIVVTFGLKFRETGSFI